MSGASRPAESSPRPGRRLVFRLTCLGFGAVALVTGLYGGLWRLGWPLPNGMPLGELHGTLMICGVFGALIALERAVAIGAAWPYAAPVLSAMGSTALLAGLPPVLGAVCFTAAAVVLAAASLTVVLRHAALFTITMLLGALALLAGNLVWMLDGTASRAAGLWLAFLVLTIAGERLELSRVLPPKAGSTALYALALLLLVAGGGLGMLSAAGPALFGTGLLACAVWLFRHDIARRTVRQPGQIRYAALCMLLGYAWLVIAGAISVSLSFSWAQGIWGYDALLHAVALGFVLSMALGHAAVIAPALTGFRIVFLRAMYLPLFLLHASVGMRVLGDVLAEEGIRRISGATTVAALLAFALCILAGSLRGGAASGSAVHARPKPPAWTGFSPRR